MSRDRARQMALEALADALREEHPELSLRDAMQQAQRLLPVLDRLMQQYNLEEAAQRATKGQPQ